jgi:urea carboxylase
MDDLSFRLGNRVVGNPPGAAGLECEVHGPTLRFNRSAIVCLAGADMGATLDGSPVRPWEPVAVAPGSVLACGPIAGPGARGYLLFRGGIDVPLHLGSRATFTLGGFGGHGGRPLRAGDVLRLGSSAVPGLAPAVLPHADRPPLTGAWEIGVLDGPHAAPDFLTDGDVAMFYATAWEVHYNSARTGVRLVGPAPQWARPDGGDAGLHPSNIHDTPYPLGAVDMTGDMPVVLGPDGPSLGGFVCPLTVVADERWKLGQLRAGDTVRFVPWTPPGAAPRSPGLPAVLGAADAREGRPSVTYRRSGDRYLLVEYGDPVLDLGLRVRVHLLMERLLESRVPGVVDVTPGIRSLQVHVDGERLTVSRALDLVRSLDDELPAGDDVRIESRVVHLPLSWDDPATREAIDRYMRIVRDDAPWCPSNLEFIRRINDLADIESVRRIVFDASYLVLGLGDVYLGAPVATPIDPRHRLVTTKYNPARTWTPENAVGIGGAYLCVYGMEGPGGYQFVGRTVPVWSRHRPFRQTTAERPWLLRFFDQIRFHLVGAEELLDLRADMVAGRGSVAVEPTVFDLAAHRRFLASHAESIEAFRAQQQAAFAAERERWRASGELDRAVAYTDAADPGTDGAGAPPAGAALVTAPFAAKVGSLDVRSGDRVDAGDRVAVLEAMKMEIAVHSDHPGTVAWMGCRPGQVVTAGHPLVAVVPYA